MLAPAPLLFLQLPPPRTGDKPQVLLDLRGLAVLLLRKSSLQSYLPSLALVDLAPIDDAHK